MIFSTKYYQLEYDNAAVHRIRSGEQEILRRVYTAVRDPVWETIEPAVLKETITRKEDSFRIQLKVQYIKDPIWVEAIIDIRGKGKSFYFRMKGSALSSFETCRMGICVLHPIRECAGRLSEVTHRDGSFEWIAFPEEISPIQCMKDVKRIRWSPGKNKQVEMEFFGDIFEMEDQRNWTDTSYKTYSRPLELPFPYRIQNGQYTDQKITLSVEASPSKYKRKEVVNLMLDKDKLFKVPSLGLSISSRQKKLSQNEAGFLKELPCDHLRHEVHFHEDNWMTALKDAIEESQLTGWSLFLVLFFTGDFWKDIHQLSLITKNKENIVKNILITSNDYLPVDKVFNQVYYPLKTIYKLAAVGTGMNAYFAELNRNRPDVQKADFVLFGICPQVHASDKSALIENLESQRYVVDQAKRLFPGKEIYISPVTLKQRFSVVGTSKNKNSSPDQLPFSVDARQTSVFAAQWMLGSLKNLIQSGVSLLTYFETVGWKGIMQGDDGPPFSDQFNARSGDLFPIYEVFRELGGYAYVVFCESSSPLEVEAIALTDQEGKFKLMLANMTEGKKIIGFPRGITWTGKLLSQPDSFLSIKNTFPLSSGEILILKTN